MHYSVGIRCLSITFCCLLSLCRLCLPWRLDRRAWHAEAVSSKLHYRVGIRCPSTTFCCLLSLCRPCLPWRLDRRAWHAEAEEWGNWDAWKGVIWPFSITSGCRCTSEISARVLSLFMCNAFTHTHNQFSLISGGGACN